MFSSSFIECFRTFFAKTVIKIYCSTIVPLKPIAVEKVGPQGKTHDRTHDATHDKTHDAILAFCVEPRSKAEIAEHCGYKNTKNFTQKYLRPLLDSGMLKMTLPDKPKSKNQKYIAIKGK